MDFLLAGTLSSLIDGVSMPGDCPASLHLLLFRLWKTFRSKSNAIPPGDKNCSPSHRNRRSPSDRIPQFRHNRSSAASKSLPEVHILMQNLFLQQALLTPCQALWVVEQIRRTDANPWPG
jgi:hypothetical protein